MPKFSKAALETVDGIGTIVGCDGCGKPVRSITCSKAWCGECTQKRVWEKQA